MIFYPLLRRVLCTTHAAGCAPTTTGCAPPTTGCAPPTTGLLSIPIPAQSHDVRLDKFLKDSFGMQWNTIQKVLRSKSLYVQCALLRKHSSPRYKLQSQDVLFYPAHVSTQHKQDKQAIQLNKQQQQGFLRAYWQYQFFRAKIIFENNNMVIINKSSHMTSQGGQIKDEDYNVYPLLRNYLVFRELMATPSFASLLLHPKANSQVLNEKLIKKLRQYLQERKVFIVHRLDKNTSGNLMVCKNKRSAQTVSDLFVEGARMEKHYLAVVRGIPKGAIHSLVMKDQIKKHLSYDNARRKAKMEPEQKSNCQTNYHIVQIYEYDAQYSLRHCYDFTSYTQDQLAKIMKKIKKRSNDSQYDGQFMCLIKVQLVGGKKHQIRAHLSQALGTPVLFDTTYGYLNQNNTFWNGLLSTLYHDNTEYHYFRDSIYSTIAQNNSNFLINEPLVLQERSHDPYNDFERHCLKEKSIMGLHSYQLTLFLCRDGQYDLFPDQVQSDDHQKIEVQSALPCFLMYFLWRSNQKSDVQLGVLLDYLRQVQV